MKAGSSAARGPAEGWAAAIIARANGEAAPPLHPHRLDVAVSDELRDALREAAANVLSPSPHPLEGCPEARKMLDWLRERTAQRLVREILRAGLGLPTMDGDRTLDRLAAWTGERRRIVGHGMGPDRPGRDSSRAATATAPSRTWRGCCSPGPDDATPSAMAQEATETPRSDDSARQARRSRAPPCPSAIRGGKVRQRRFLAFLERVTARNPRSRAPRPKKRP